MLHGQVEKAECLAEIKLLKARNASVQLKSCARVDASKTPKSYPLDGVRNTADDDHESRLGAPPINVSRKRIGAPPRPPPACRKTSSTVIAPEVFLRFQLDFENVVLSARCWNRQIL